VNFFPVYHPTQTMFLKWPDKRPPLLGSYYNNKLELKSNSSEILPVNYKLICDSIPT